MILLDLQSLEVSGGSDDALGFGSIGDSELSLLLCHPGDED
ncbi:SapB/AmfS family lanthipeptide [Streptomyces hiroshimensis]